MPSSVNPLQRSRISPRIPGTNHSNQCRSAPTSSNRAVDTPHEPRNSAKPPEHHQIVPLRTQQTFPQRRIATIHPHVFRQKTHNRLPPPHTVHYEHATAACNPEPSRELLKKFPSQRAIALTPRRPCPVAIRPQSGEALGNLGVNCAGTNHCVSTARKNDSTCRWQLIASTPWCARLDLKPKR